MEKLQIWGGIECTINRVGGRYFDQLDRCGHLGRRSDIELVSSLGISKLRYPILWERVCADGADHYDWDLSDQQLPTLQRLGVEPICGLIHHGSGPRFTELTDPCFASKFQSFALAVARRYPNICWYTPINEPLTTARFSCLYGHWYPHQKCDKAFAQAVINQAMATVLAMRAIRSVNPSAKLVQTEDVGRIYSTPGLSYQAEFENERRWLSLDLLCGSVDRGHALYDYLMSAGANRDDLEWLVDNPFAPDIIGLNHYVTSDRYLDEQIDRYPKQLIGGNGRKSYCDTEAVRSAENVDVGFLPAILDAWKRYNLPIAVTEVHLGCTREEQMRWFLDAWRAACDLRGKGVRVEAVTAWALLGSMDWNSLLTQDNGHYEEGAFDIRSKRPRITALGKAIKTVAKSGKFEHPVVASPGWWQRNIRFTGQAPEIAETRVMSAPPILIAGGSGTLGSGFAKICRLRGLSYRLLSRSELDIASPEHVRRAIDRYKPWAIINAAGFVRVDEAELKSDQCRRENINGPLVLASLCRQAGIRLVTFSSDLVFDGNTNLPYKESSKPRPLNTYGASKRAAEELVLGELSDALIVRTAAFFGPWDRYNFLWNVLASVQNGQLFQACEDEIVSPTYLPHLIHATLNLLIDEETGIWHLANEGEISWYQFALEAAGRARIDCRNILKRRAADMNRPAARPSYSALTSEKAFIMPSLESGISSFFSDHTFLSVCA